MLKLLLSRYFFQRQKSSFESIKDNKLKQICKRNRGLNPKKHVELSNWVEKIRNAKLNIISPSIEWKEDDTLIQVKQMLEKDLKEPAQLPAAKHEFEQRLDVLKLPLPIPTLNCSEMSQFLFVRPDDYELFVQFGVTSDESILIGNPGISKSWFQWKFILFCYRPDIFNALWTSDRVKGKVPEANLDGLKKIEQIEHFFMPEIIVRTIAGKLSCIFSIHGSNDVIYFRHEPSHLGLFTPSNSTLLWEAGADRTPVVMSEIFGHTIATLSPKEDRYHQFKKVAETVYMPCPSELQIRLMGQIFRDASDTPNSYPSDKEIHDRVIEYGPFIRSSLLWSTSHLGSFSAARQKNIDRICDTEDSLLFALESFLHIVEYKRNIGGGCTHRMAMFSINRDHKFCYYLLSTFYEFSSKTVLDKICQHIAQLDMKTLKKHLIRFIDENCSFESVLPEYLEQICVAHFISKNGFTWKAIQARQQSTKDANITILNNLTSVWQPFSAQFDRIERGITTYDDMKRGVLYYPSDKSFPLVNMYYKDEDNNLIGIQPTVDQRHENLNFQLESFFRKLNTTTEQSPLQLYYLIFPRMLPQYAKHDYPPSQVTTIVNVDETQKWTNSVHFHILLPPDDFEATFLYDHV